MAEYTYYVMCCICDLDLEVNTQCDHCQHLLLSKTYETQKDVVVKKSVFGDQIKTVKEVIEVKYSGLKCRCGWTLDMTSQSLKGDHECTYQDIHNVIKYSYTQWNLSSRRLPSGHQHRRYCTGCKGSGQITHKLFKKCENCEGTGGTMCLNCCGSGTLTIHSKKSIYDIPIQVKCGRCQFGYEDRCYFCQGKKAIVTGNHYEPCNLCIDVPKGQSRPL